MKWLTILTSGLLAFATHTATAQDQEVTGEVIEASADANELRIRVTETDDGRPERVGQLETYSVPPGTPIEVDEANRFRTGSTISRNVTPEEDVELSDLRAGDEVTIAFQESAMGRQATGVRQRSAQDNQQQQQAAQQGQDSRDDTYAANTQARDRLPGSASPLPLLALAGAGFALSAAALRFRRRR
jgi:hypothetical protein